MSFFYILEKETYTLFSFYGFAVLFAYCLFFIDMKFSLCYSCACVRVCVCLFFVPLTFGMCLTDWYRFLGVTSFGVCYFSSVKRLLFSSHSYALAKCNFFCKILWISPCKSHTHKMPENTKQLLVKIMKKST